MLFIALCDLLEIEGAWLIRNGEGARAFNLPEPVFGLLKLA